MIVVVTTAIIAYVLIKSGVAVINCTQKIKIPKFVERLSLFTSTSLLTLLSV